MELYEEKCVDQEEKKCVGQEEDEDTPESLIFDELLEKYNEIIKENDMKEHDSLILEFSKNLLKILILFFSLISFINSVSPK